MFPGVLAAAADAASATGAAASAAAQRAARKQYEDEHRGHEGMHAMMMLMYIALLLGAQALFFWWRQRSARSFHSVSLLGVWIIPMAVSVYRGNTRFVILWTIYTAACGYIMYLASRKPLVLTTPRLVYSFFTAGYRLSYILAILGYAVMIADAFQFGAVLGMTDDLAVAGILMIYYGLYFGILGRDFARWCTDRMSSTMGYTSSHADGRLATKRLDPNLCAICGRALFASNLRYRGSDDQQAAPPNEDTCELACHHFFHERCIRGWAMIGKKDMCPYCHEKVDLTTTFTNPWEARTVLWGTLLDALRYLIVWNPLIGLVAQVVIHVMGWK